MPWTPEQFLLAAERLDQISALSMAMRGHVLNFETGIMDSVTLTTQQKDYLKTLFTQGKQQLHQLWTELPDLPP